MKLLIVLSSLFVCMSLLPAQETEPDQPQEMKTLVEKYSYILGRNLVDDFKGRGVDVDVERLVQGIREASEARKSPLSNEEVVSVMQTFQKNLLKKEQEMFADLAAKNLADGKKFLDANREKDGVLETESGLQYKVLQEGDGEKPTLEDHVKLHFTGKFLDGKKFTGTDPKQPPQLSVGAIPVRGLAEAISRMPAGSKWEIYIPANLAFGLDGTPAVGPNETLIYEVELLEIIRKK